jgi:hypothetical protein
LISGGVLILSFSYSSELLLALLFHFAWSCRFSCLLLVLAVFLILDDLLEIFLGFFGLLSVLHGVLDSNFKLCDFVVNGLIKGEIEKPSGQFLSFIAMSHWLGKVWIWIWDGSVVLLLALFHLENRVCLSRDVQVAGAARRAATRIVAGVGVLMKRTRDGRTGRVLGGRVIERSGGAVCDLHRARGDEERGFLGWASKLRSVGWTQNHWDGLSMV